MKLHWVGMKLRLAVLAVALPPTAPRLVFESVSHLGSLPDERADASFLLSFFELEQGASRFVVTKAANGTTMASRDGGISWTPQADTAALGSYAALPTLYENLGGWPPQTGLPVAYQAVALPDTYEPAAPANFTYTGTLVTLSAERLAPCLALGSGDGKPPTVGTRVSWSFVSRNNGLCAFPTNGSRTVWDGHVCAADGSILWENFSTPYHFPGACSWNCSAANQWCNLGGRCGEPAPSNPSLPARVCAAGEEEGGARFHVSSDGPAVRYTGLPAAAVQFIPGDGNVVRLNDGT